MFKESSRLISSDKMHLICNVELAAADIPPIADAGSDLSIQLPNDTIILDGSGSFDDLAIVSYEWMAEPGETKSYTLLNGDNVQAQVADLEEGTYTFTLRVTDNVGLTDEDKITVTVEGTESNLISVSLLYFL